MKSKKLISLLCAAAMTTSAFAGLVTTASAETGDQLASFDFETVDWGSPSRTDKWTTTYAEYEDATKPAEVAGKSMIMNSLEGNNCSVMHAMTVTTSPTGSYNLDFDLRLTSADYKTGQTQNEDKSWTTNDRELGTGDEKYEYVYGFGNTAKPTSGDATGNNMFEIRVKGDSVYMNNGSADLYDTTIDVPITGAWFHFDVTADTKSGKYKGTITPYAEGAEAVEIPSMSFQSATATALTAFFASSVRYDGSIKGLVKDGVLDNVVITEAENINPSNITIKYVDATSGEEIKASETVSSETGSSYTAPASKKANFTIDGDTENYYKYVEEGSVDTIESVSSDESNNVITLKFEKAALVDFTVNAVTTSGATIKQLYTKKAMPGATETFFNTIYITEAGQSYKAKDTTNYKVEAVVADNGTVANVVYKKADNLVFYSEAEDYADCMYEDGKSLDNDSRYSGGKVRVPSIGNNYTNGFATDPVAEAGEYILSFNSHDNKRGIIVAKVSADGTITDLTGTTEDDYFKAGAYESEPIQLEAGDYFKLYCAEGKAPWGSKQINNVDYIDVTTPAEAVEPEAAVTYTKAERKATVTVTNAEDVADTVNAVLVHASYTGDVLKSVTAHDVTMNVAGDGSIAADVVFGEDEAVREGDKLMVWDSLSGMKAMAAVPYVITAEEADVIATYTVTVDEGITGGTVVASLNTAEEGDTVTLTVTPNADMQLKADSLKVMNGENAVAVTPGTAANTYTFTMPAGNVTVTAEFEAVAVEPDEITGTVTVSGTAKVGETLTAVVSGLNEGATAKYQWQANTGADDAYVNIENATASTFVVTEDLVGKTIKVVVTADGYTGTIESAPTAAVVAADEPVEKFAVTVAEATNGTVQVDKQTAAEGEEVTITATPNLGYEVGTVAVAPTDVESETVVSVSDNKFTMPAEAVTVTVTFVQKANAVLSTASTYISRYSGLDEDINTQIGKNYSDDTKVFIGSDGNFNAMGFYEFDAPEIPADKEIASATLTFVNQKMNNTNGDSSLDVNYPNVTTGINLSTITWSTMFTQTTVDTPTAKPWENVQADAPFQSVTKLSTVSLAKAETNATHTADVTAYVKEQAAKGEKIVLVLNNCTRGANLDKVAMIEYTLGEKHYAVNVTDPEAENGTLSVDKTEALANETVTITATAAAGKKITGVTVSKAEGTVDVTDNQNGTYTFTMPAEDVTVAATYDRADINNISVTGPATISVNAPGTPTYVGTAYADAEKQIPLTATMTYSIEAVDDLAIDSGTSIDSSTGVLTVAAGQTAGKIKVIATSEGKTGEMEVELTSEAVYTVTSATGLTGGTVSTNVQEAISGAEVIVTATPDTGYEVTTVSYTPDEGEETVIQSQEGVYKFTMPEKNVTVSATFSKINYTITNNATEEDKDTNNGYVTVNGTANYGDTVTVTVTPNSGYDLDTLKYSGTTTPETSINNVEGAYTFVMPAENVTITATFQAKAVERAVIAGVDVSDTIDTSAVREGNRRVLIPTNNQNIDLTKAYAAKKDQVTFDFDFNIANDESLAVTMGNKSSSAFNKQSSTVTFTGANGTVTATQTYSGSGAAEVENVLEGSGTMSVGTWYRATITTNVQGSGDSSYLDHLDVAVYAVDPETCAIGELVTSFTTRVRSLNDEGTYSVNRIQLGVTGTPSIDNAYVYGLMKYNAEITVNDGSLPIEDVTVTVNDTYATTAQTNSEGKVTMSLPVGTYTVTVDKVGYIAPAEAQTMEVTTDGATKTITMTSNPQVLTSVGIYGGVADHTVLTSSSDRVVAKLSAKALDGNGDEMLTPYTIDWTSSSVDTTVVDGVVTVKNTQTPGQVTITATVNGQAVSKDYVITVAATGTEVVPYATDDFEGETSIFTLANGAFIDTFKDSKVLKFGAQNGASATVTYDNAVVAEDGKKVEVTWNAYNGWLSNGADTVWTLKNSDGEVVLSYTYNTGNCNVTAVTLGGVTQTFSAFNFQNNGSRQNGWTSFSAANQNSVKLTLNSDGSAEVDFIKGGSSVQKLSVDSSTSTLTTKDIKTVEFTNAATNEDRSGGFDNFKTSVIAE